MKKILLSIVVSIASLILFCCLRTLSAKAVDTEFSVASRVILASEVDTWNSKLTAEYPDLDNHVGHDAVQAGDIMVDVYLTHNTGYAGSGVGIYIDTANFYALASYHDNQGLGGAILAGEASDYIQMTVSKLYNASNGIIGITTNSFGNETDDGIYTTFFLRAKTNATDLTHPVSGIKVTQFCTAQNVDIDYEIETQTQCEYIPYILGDLNGDGVVNTNDSNYLMSAISNGNITRATLANQFVGMAGMYYHNQVIFEVADVNSDNVINQTDANLILTYYNYILLEINYNGPIGTQLYITVTYNITIVT